MKKRIFSHLLILATMATGIVAPSVRRATAQEQRTITVSAAISLKDALDEVGLLYKRDHPGTRVVFNYGSSGTLQHQIEQGAPVDVFVSAASRQMDSLEKEGALDSGTRRNLVGNELVLIVPGFSERVKDFADLAKPEIKTIALGEPATVPAGMYAKQMFEHSKMLEAIEKKAVYAKDVRAVLTYVETGNADAGLVYRTDAQTSSKVRVVTAAPPRSHDPIVYPAAVLKDAKNIAEARALLNFLSSSEAKAVFAKHGFTSPDGTAENN